MSEKRKSLNGPTRVRDDLFKPVLRPVFEVDLGAELGAEAAKKSQQRDLRNSVICQSALVAWRDDECWIRYSRDRNAYTNLRFCYGPSVSYPNMMWAIETLEMKGLITHERKKPWAAGSYQSRFKAAKALLKQVLLRNVRDMRLIRHRLIELRDCDKRPIKYFEDDFISSMRNEMIAQNEVVQSARIEPTHADWQMNEQGLLIGPEKMENPIRRTLYRVFNVSWSRGGRSYGGFWQNLPEDVRAEIRIDGSLTVEPDYDYLHPTLMAEIVGKGWGEGDPYIINGFPRPHIKLALNTMINASARTSAQRAIADDLDEDFTGSRYVYARQLMGAVEARHPQFETLWCTGIGALLMRSDSDMCASVLCAMRDKGIVALPVHDSFIVPAASEGLVREAMHDALILKKRQLKSNFRKSVGM